MIQPANTCFVRSNDLPPKSGRNEQTALKQLGLAGKSEEIAADPIDCQFTSQRTGNKIA